jgi:hypothetical protein
MQNPFQDANRVVRVTPTSFNLGSIYDTSIIEGDFKTYPCVAIRAVSLNPVSDSTGLTLSKPLNTSAGYTLWPFTLTPKSLGPHHVSVQIETDYGTVHQSFGYKVLPASSAIHSVSFVTSPFVASAESHEFDTLDLIIRELRSHLNAFRLSSPPDLKADVLVLSGCGIIHPKSDALRSTIGEQVDAGRVVILFANYFLRGTVDTANAALGTYGVRLLDTEYDETTIDLQQVSHPAITNVKRLRLWRASPILVDGDARPLVRNPSNSKQCFLACCGPRHNLYVVGLSSPAHLLAVGWPFHNQQLFANLLCAATQGDAQ